MGQPGTWLLIWACIASLIILYSDYRIKRLQAENDRLWKLVNRMMNER